jgi:hypothetical protein
MVRPLHLGQHKSCVYLKHRLPVWLAPDRGPLMPGLRQRQSGLCGVTPLSAFISPNNSLAPSPTWSCTRLHNDFLITHSHSCSFSPTFLEDSLAQPAVRIWITGSSSFLTASTAHPPFGRTGCSFLTLAVSKDEIKARLVWLQSFPPALLLSPSCWTCYLFTKKLLGKTYSYCS